MTSRFTQADIRTVEDYWRFRFQFDIDVWHDFVKLMPEHYSLHEPLGALLQIPVWNHEDTVESTLCELIADCDNPEYPFDLAKEYEDADITDLWLDIGGSFAEQVGSAQEFTQTIEELESQGIPRTQVVSWYQGQSPGGIYHFMTRWIEENKELVWNPPYAETEPSPESIVLAERFGPRKFLDGFKVYQKGGPVYPCNGWTLAELLRISYEAHKE